MANKERNKRSARKARSQEREELQNARVAAGHATAPQADGTIAKAESKNDKPAKAKAKKTGFIYRTKQYLRAVRTEMHRVVWPSRDELKNYAIAVIAMLIIFGVAIWLVDTGILSLVFALSGLRG